LENYHLFIADENSLRFHIEFGFVGTGYTSVDFNIGIWKDIQRLKIGDKIIFYVQNLKKFFGVFRVASNPFFDSSNPLYLTAANPVITVNGTAVSVELRYRALIVPDIVYENGIDEFQLVDILPPDTKSVLWSILYRKLKAKRGNSPLFPSEYATVFQKLAAANPGGPLNHPGYSFDGNHIIPRRQGAAYVGNTAENSVVKSQILQGHFSEHHLHALLLKSVPNQVFGPNPRWIGNEIYSGAGMQAIDLMGITNNDGHDKYWPIEVKRGVIPTSIFSQIEKYCRWIAGRFALARPESTIQPVLVGSRSSTRQKRSRSPMKIAFDNLRVSLPLKYFEYEVNQANNNIRFEEIDLTSSQFNSTSSFII
jgi:hypothetical protein